MSKLKRPAGSFIGQDNQVFKLGPMVGMAAEFPLKKRLSFQAEVMYSLKGLKDNSVVPRGSFGDYHGYGYNFHCLELPLLLRMSFNNNLKVGFGPSVTWLTNIEEIMEGINVTEPGRPFTSFDWGLNGDISYLFKRFEFGARYYYGLQMIKYNGDSDPEFPANPNITSIGQNRTFQVYVAYVFRR